MVDAAVLQLANLEVKCGDLLVGLGDHLGAGIDLIRGSHVHTAQDRRGRSDGGHSNATALGLFNTSALTLELRDLTFQLFEGGTILLHLRAKDPQALFPGFDFLIEPNAVGVGHGDSLS